MSEASDCPRAVRDWLAASTEISNAVADRIYPDVMPQGVHADRILISQTSFEPADSLGGETGVATSIIQIDYWAEGPNAPQNAYDGGMMIRNRLSGYRGALNEHVTGVCNLISGPRVVASSPTDGSDNHRRRSVVEFQITHTVAVPDFA
jgi:hypothetical protein